MKVTVIPSVDPAEARQAAGLNARGSFYAPRQRRPGTLKGLQGRPEGWPERPHRESV